MGRQIRADHAERKDGAPGSAPAGGGRGSFGGSRDRYDVDKKSSEDSGSFGAW
jgi:hypothetical protein